MNKLTNFLPEEILNKFEVYNYNHAAEILTQSFPSELGEILNVLRTLEIHNSEITAPGGSESTIPRKFSTALAPLNWRELRITGDLLIKFYPREKGAFLKQPKMQKTIENYIDGHNIDFIKGRVAIDIEWNSKDQTFDRDLYAMRTYYECDIISVGIIITRAQSLNSVFKKLDVLSKYGASTTWIGKLLPRLDSRRHGGCPILAIGITENCVTE